MKELIDADSILTGDDLTVIATAREEKKLGKLTGLETLKKQLGL